jgi:hypothetical protein
VKVEHDHYRCEEREGEEEEDEMSEGPFRVNRDEARRLGYRDEVFIRDYEAGCQRILDGMKRMQRARQAGTSAHGVKRKSVEDRNEDEQKGKMPKGGSAQNHAVCGAGSGKTVLADAESKQHQLQRKSTRPEEAPPTSPILVMAEDVPTAEEPLGPTAAPTGKAPCKPLQRGSRQVASMMRSLPRGPASVVVEGAPASNATTEGVEKTGALKPLRRLHRRTKPLPG